MPRNKSSLSVVCFKWHKNSQGVQLPGNTEYTSEHVNILKNSVKRNLTMPHRFICITDDWAGIDLDIEVIKLWDKCKYLGGCYNRLFVFSEIMREFLGDRFVCIDLDTVIVNNLDRLFSRKEDFIINQYLGSSKQLYNGSLFMMNSGARSEVWDKFDATESVADMQPRKDNGELIGTDQAWIAHLLGNKEAMFTEKDGVFDYRRLPNKRMLPRNAKIVTFPGSRDPSTEINRIGWIKEHWR